ncbi:putative arginine exporter protein [Oscillibacter valericigenes Sjm18-20]|nr:putative arginine exporter protein [Oscillibacter valericigenes Sjm18-20]
MEFFSGLLMGLAYVAPIGVQNLFVINTALTQPRRRALLTALAVIFFDVSLALACFFGVGAVLSSLPWLRQAMLGAGGAVVTLIGVNLVCSKEAAQTAAETEVLPWSKVIATACVATWCNPQAILDGTMMLGAFRASLSSAAGLRFIAGVACASCLWFLSVAALICVFARFFTPKLMRIVNIICGSVVAIYGLKLLWQFFTSF